MSVLEIQLSLLLGIFAGYLFMTLYIKYRKKPTKKQEQCGNCIFWDQDAGQAILLDHKDFARAAAIIPPCKMGVPHDIDGNPTAHNGMPLASKWTDFGLCLKESDTIVWSGDTACKLWMWDKETPGVDPTPQAMPPIVPPKPDETDDETDSESAQSNDEVN
jgi:hypothetical protein